MEKFESNFELIRQKYQAERARRLRPEGQDQYIRTSGEFAAFSDDDPYSARVEDRAPLHDEVKMLVIGGGFAGLFTAAKLKEAGLAGIRIVEAGSDFGGTWYWNRYPGCQCDVESYCYLPLLEETGYMPKEKFSFAPEIFDYCKIIGRKFGLYESALFQTRVTELRWQAHINRWKVSTNRGIPSSRNMSSVHRDTPTAPSYRALPGSNSSTERCFIPRGGTMPIPAAIFRAA